MSIKVPDRLLRMVFMAFAVLVLSVVVSTAILAQTDCEKASYIRPNVARKISDDTTACWVEKIKNGERKLEGAYLVRANLANLSLRNIELGYSNLTGANLSNADLREANLRHVKLGYSNLTGANLSNADLREAELRDAILTDANLTGANLSGVSLYVAILNNTNLTGAYLYDANLYQANMNKAILTNAKLSGAGMLRAKLAGADLTGADLSDADLSEVDFGTSILTNAVVLKSTTIGVDFELWRRKGGIVDETSKGESAGEANLINAETYTVDNVFDKAALNKCTSAPNDCSLRGAIINANASTVNQTIDFDSSMTGKRILLRGKELSISKTSGSLAIVGKEGDRLMVSANFKSRVFLVGGGADVTFARITIKSGSINETGAGIHNAAGGKITLIETTVTGCHSTNGGGGIYNAGTAYIKDSEVLVSMSSNGGGIHNRKGKLTVDSSTIRGNGAKSGDGGGIYNNGGEVAVQKSTLISNSGRSGGGIANFGGKFALADSTVIYNDAVGDSYKKFGVGGGIFGKEGSFYVFNSTISGNRTVNDGGGISLSGTAMIVSSTISDNQIRGSRGAGVDSGNELEKVSRTGKDTIIIVSTIVAGNRARDRNIKPPDVSGVFASSGYNLIGNIGSGSKAGIGFGAPDQIGGGNNPIIMPLLGHLDDNGGPTATHTLLCGSPAIDAGSNSGSSITTDQRGKDRPRVVDYPDIENKEDGADIGAFEVQPPENCRNARAGEVRADGTIQGPIINYVVDNASDDAALSACTSAVNDCSLRAVINSANASEGDDIINFDESLTGQTITLGGSALSIAKNGETTINGSGADRLTISGNKKSRVFFIAPGAKVEINGLTIRDGYIKGKENGYTGGGGIMNRGKLTMKDSVITKNTSFGADIFNGYAGGIGNHGTLVMTNSTISANTATRGGSGLHNHGSASLTGSTVSGNSTTSDFAVGGGLRNVMSGRLSLTGSTVNGNKSARGGGIHNMGDMTIANSTLSNNEATNGEGGGFSNTKGTLLIRNSTVTANKAKSDVGLDEATAMFMPAGGGGIYNSSRDGDDEDEDVAIVTIANTIVAGNTDGGNTADVWGKFVSKGFNLIGDVGTGKNAGTGFGDDDQFGGGTNPVIDALLGALADNGGPVKTHVLLCGSLAIDAGKNLVDAVTDDQRGKSFVRLFDDPNINNKGDGTDIGAFEVQESLRCSRSQ